VNPCLLFLTLLQAAPRPSAGSPLDEGVLVVRIDTAEVARESFRLSAGRLSRGGEGWILATTIRYDRARPVIVLSPILEVNGDTMPATLQYDVADPRQPARVLGELGRGRFTVRFVARDTERAREFPTSQHAVVLDDSVFATYLFAAWQAQTEPVTLAAIFPRALRRETVQVQDLGLESATRNPDGPKLRHISVTGGSEVVHLWLDAGGRLMRLHIPSRRLTAERLAGS
jgi:hypothetical protein